MLSRALDMDLDAEFNSATLNVREGTEEGFSFFQTVSTNYGFTEGKQNEWKRIAGANLYTQGDGVLLTPRNIKCNEDWDSSFNSASL